MLHCRLFLRHRVPKAALNLPLRFSVLGQPHHRDRKHPHPARDINHSQPHLPPQQNPYLNPAANPAYNSSYNRPTSTPPNPNAQPNPYFISTTPAPSANAYASPVNQYQPPAVPVSYTPVPHHTPAPPPSTTPVPVSYTPVPHHTPAPPPSTTPLPVTSPTGPPPLWAGPPVDPSPGGFSFPVPTVLSGAPETEPYQPPWAQGPPPNRVESPYDHQPYGHHRRVSDPRADPNLHARYQTPLPLPPGERNQRPAESSPPPPRRDASPASYSPPSHSPRPAPTSPPKPSRQHSGPDYKRLQELVGAEDNAKRRWEQEQKDLELAMQLDRELNL
ncbi:hypothetical protein H1R20_g12451, partial [Candolleomyces eurysporus]